MDHAEFTAIYTQLMDILATAKRIEQMVHEIAAELHAMVTEPHGAGDAHAYSETGRLGVQR